MRPRRARPAARGRGAAPSLRATEIADAARDGRDRVALEVDADSPTKADQLYRSLGWETDYVTESWFKDLDRLAVASVPGGGGDHRRVPRQRGPGGAGGG